MFQDWINFYFMMGSAGAGLIGLLFVVVTLTSSFDRSQASRGINYFMSPTALHFGSVLSISAVAMAPGLPDWATALIFGFIAVVGLAIAVRSCVGIRTMRSAPEPPDWSDFWTYGCAPAAIYLGLCAASGAVWARAAWAPYAMAALVLVLLLLGIRNSWDLVTWIVPRRPGDAQ